MWSSSVRLMRVAALAGGLLLAGMALAAPQFPALTGRVVDGAHLLSPGAAQGLDAQLAAFEAKTGDQLVVVTLPTLNGQPIEQYGYQLGRHWGIGQKGKDNGVLLIVAPNERRVRIEVGYGLEGTLTDARTSQIIQGIIVPRFKAGDMQRGILSGAQAIMKLAGGEALAESDAVPSQASGAHGSDRTAQWIFFALLMVFLFSQVMLFVLYLIGSIIGFVLSLFGFHAFDAWLRRIRARVVPEDKALIYWLLMPSSRVTGSGGGSFFSGGGGGFGGGGSSGSW